MPRHHFGVSTIGGSANVKSLTIDPKPEIPKSKNWVLGLLVAYDALKLQC